MPSSRPPATDLLAVVMEYLESDVAPRVPSVQQFQLKIVARALSTVKRELEQGPSADAAEAKRLAALLRHDGDLDDQRAALARAIRHGDFAVDDPALLAHLRETVEDALRINNPKWLN